MRHLKTIQRPTWNLHKILVEQANDEPFQRGWLLNVGIVEANKRFHDSNACVVTHDVDMMADNLVDYAWCDRPTQVCSELSCFKEGIPYSEYSGGVIQAKQEHWYRINGYTNKAVGWGGEDDDLFHRFRMNSLLNQTTNALRRPAKTYGKCYCMNDNDHTKRIRNQKGYSNILKQIQHMRQGSNEWEKDGLNSLQYSVLSEHSDAYDTIHLKVHHRSVLYLTLIGRLGNQLFQWASAQGIASKNGMSLCINIGHQWHSIFDTFQDVPTPCKDSPSGASILPENGKYATYRDLEIHEYYREGLFAVFPYTASNVYESLKFKDSLIAKAREQLFDATNIGIHVRHQRKPK